MDSSRSSRASPPGSPLQRAPTPPAAAPYPTMPGAPEACPTPLPESKEAAFPPLPASDLCLPQWDPKRMAELEESRQANLETRRALDHVQDLNTVAAQQLEEAKAQQAALQWYIQGLEADREQLLKKLADAQVTPPTPPVEHPMPAGRSKVHTPHHCQEHRVYAPMSSLPETGPRSGEIGHPPLVPDLLALWRIAPCRSTSTGR